MYYSASNCASTLSSGENSVTYGRRPEKFYCAMFLEKEVFRKEALETKVKEGMDEKRGKQKRRDRVSKAKAQSAKSKVSYIIYGVLFTRLAFKYYYLHSSQRLGEMCWLKLNPRKTL